MSSGRRTAVGTSLHMTIVPSSRPNSATVADRSGVVATATTRPPAICAAPRTFWLAASIVHAAAFVRPLLTPCSTTRYWLAPASAVAATNRRDEALAGGRASDAIVP